MTRLALCARLLAALCVITVATPAFAASKKKGRAKKEFRLAEKLYRRGKFKQAANHYAAAYALTPFPSMLFSLGQCHRRAGDWERAISFYEDYLRDKPKGTSARKAKAHIKECKAKRKAEAPEEPPEPDEPEEAAEGAEPAPPPEPTSLELEAGQPPPAEPTPAATEATRPAEPEPSAGEPAEAEPAAAEPEATILAVAAPVAPAAAPGVGGASNSDLMRRAPPAVAEEGSIVNRWWFWTIIGTVVVAGTTTGLVVWSETNVKTIPPAGTLGVIDTRETGNGL